MSATFGAAGSAETPQTSWNDAISLTPGCETARRRLFILAVLAIALVAAGAGAAPALAASGWSIQATPALNGPPQGVLWGDSCSGANACTGVGDYVDPSGTSVAVADRWNGVAWISQATPSVPGGGVLYDASCTSATSCVAVGWSYGGVSGAKEVLAEQWNGTTWAVEQTPTPGGASSSLLAGVSCTSGNSCTAVGYSVNDSGTEEPLAEVWNGSVWATQPTASPSGGGALSRVSCSAASACTAVGSANGGPLVERWNGSAWSIQTIAIPSGATSMQLYGVSCAGTAACIVVGHWMERRCTNGQPTCNCFRYPCIIKLGTLAEQWNGSAWTVQTTPAAGNAVLYNVSCAGTPCTAVGASATNTALIDEWNGTSWVSETAPAGSRGLSGVSCATAATCEAVGAVNGAASAEGSNGATWVMQSTPNPPGPANQPLTGISCPTSSTCTAVGSYTDISGERMMLAEDWNGGGWSSQTTTNPSGATSSSLARVSCTSSATCIAVGNYVNSSGVQVTLAEGWNGSTWTIQTTPNPAGAISSSLADVSCTSSSACTAVGDYVDSTGTEATLAETWNGIVWAIQSTPDPPGAGGDALAGVSCISSLACTAVGYAGVNADDQATLAETWNGAAWAVQTTASPSGETDSNLLAVSCASAISCTAVGGQADFSTTVTYGMLAEHFDGSSWTVEPIPPPSGAPGSSLFSVSCTTDTACTAVGYYNDNEYPEVTGDTPIAESWNGTAWSTQLPFTVPGATISGLFGVSCTASTACTAVGNSQNSTGTYSLAEDYSG